MKRMIYLLATVFIAFSLNAQTTGGPDNYGYIWKSNTHTVNPPTYNWFDISVIGNEVTGLADDNFVGPFNCTGFQFYWYPVTQFWIGSNGYISFSPQNIASPFPVSVPLTSGANNWIAPLMADLNFAGTGNNAACYYYANADTICVSFINVPFWANNTTSYTGSNSFQVILNKVDKSITFNYLSTNLGTVTTLDDVVGIENNSGNLGLSSLIDALPTSASTRKFYYPSTVTYAVTDGGMNWNGNTKNGGYFIEAVQDTIYLMSNVKNFGNQNLGSFTVKDTVFNFSNAMMSLGSETVPSLGSGTDTLIHFTNTFIAPAAGIYKFNTGVSGITGDMVASNNYISQEIVAVNSAATTISLDYSDGIADGGGIGWNGGDGGIAVYIEPPIYPAKIVNSKFYISANATIPAGFHAMIYDNLGANGGPGNLLDSVFVAGNTIITNTYTTVNTSNNVIINNGGVYLLWLMDSAGINLARDLTPPISRQTYEVISGGWSGYRDLLTEDFLMGLTISKVALQADFYADLTNSPTVVFSDSSSDNPTSWLWNFGISGATSMLQNPTYTYPMNGNYHVCLTATNSSGSDSVCKTISILNPPIADFTYDASNSPTISFTDSSLNGASWSWDFGVAGATSTVQNPSYTFPGNGTYTVCLTVYNTVGIDSICKVITIQNAPMAAFNFDASNSPSVAFTDVSVDADSWAWDFGVAGGTSSMQNPSYNYTANGTYHVCLTATNTFGSDSACHTVIISNIGMSKSINEKYVRIYPNPNNGKFELELIGQNSTMEFSLFSSIGTRIMSEKIETSTVKKFDLEYLPKGLYYIKLQNNNGDQFISKLILK